jgi:hypothetical protein
MTKKTKLTEYQIEHLKELGVNKKAMAGLTPRQLKAIVDTRAVLFSVTNMISECQDLYLTDIAKLNQAFWDMENAFKTEASWS